MGILRKIGVVLVVLGVLVCHSEGAFATEPRPLRGLAQNDKSFQPEFEGAGKLGVQLKQRWVRAMEVGVLWIPVECRVKLSSSLDKLGTNGEDLVLLELKKAGFKEQTVLKTVVTGSIAIGKLPDLVRLKGVKAVELSRQVGYKDGLTIK